MSDHRWQFYDFGGIIIQSFKIFNYGTLVEKAWESCQIWQFDQKIQKIYYISQVFLSVQLSLTMHGKVLEQIRPDYNLWSCANVQQTM